MSSYTVTDQQLLNEIQYTLLETANSGSSMTTTIWTISEVIQYLNDRQRKLLRETGIVAKQDILGGAVHTRRFEAPADCISIRRLAWHDADGSVKELACTDPWAVDNITHLTAPNKPKVYWESATPSLQFEVEPPAIDIGYFHIIYLSIEAALSNSGIACCVPDEFTPYIKYGVLADCWKKAGPGQDLIRATYCEERFQEGIDLGHALMAHGGINE